MRRNRSGFTMIEVVMVITIIGILATLALPRMSRDLRQEAIDNILSAVRYTQHLALVDDKTDPADSEWQKKLWKITFTINGTNSYYTISSDSDKDGVVDKLETAMDPANGTYMYHLNTNPTAADESTNILIGKNYGINGITFSGGCPSNVHHIGFDRLGRPHVSIGSAANDYRSYMTSDCNITFSFAKSGIDPFSLIVTKETGFSYVEGEPNM